MTDRLDTTAALTPAPYARLQHVNHADVRWTGGFWGERFELCETVILPRMYEALNNEDNSAVFSNFYVAAGRRQGPHRGTYWSDGDCYKWMEAASYVFGVTGNRALDQQLDELIEVIGQSQAEDGYLCTQIQLTDEARWQHPRFHELYNMGHLLTAAHAHHQVTGKDGFLQIACRLADYLYQLFQPRPEHLAHFGFNPANMMGAVDLYRATGERRYLALAQIFVDMRGSVPGGTDQNQDHVSLRAETDAVGHAVTATYLYCGAADLFAETGEMALLTSLKRIWHDVVQHKMYITGGVGPLHHGESKHWDHVAEAFAADYQLPNATAYNETCANIGNAMWNWRMLQLTGEAKYADVMEQVLYNSGLSGMSVDGQQFRYTNPLRWYGEHQALLSNDTRQRWTIHECYCCPPQVARTIARIQEWAYSVAGDQVWVHLYGSNQLRTRLADGSRFELDQETDYPWQGTVKLRIQAAPECPLALRLRVPGWADGAQIAVNGEDARDVPAGTYTDFKQIWRRGDVIEMILPLRVRTMKAHPKVEEVKNQVAIMRGPLVYCLEGVDLPEGVSVAAIHINSNVNFAARFEPASLGGLTVLVGQGQSVVDPTASDGLYVEAGLEHSEPIDIQMIPYYAWNNRGISEMSVWLPRGQ